LLYKYNNYILIIVISSYIVLMNQTNEEKLNSIADNILLFFPFFYRKMLRVTHINSRSNPINTQFHVLVMLISQGDLPATDIGRRFGISRPNVTSLVDRLIEQGYAKRYPDSSDRRVINIAATERGRQFVVNRKKQAKLRIKKNLAGLKPDDLEKLYNALDTFAGIVSKIGNG
jgi:DNA-binding MarR family transcriptional regulator